MNKIGKVVGKPTDERTFQGSEALVLSRCFIGMEVELEEVRRMDKVESKFGSLWLPERDGSLRNDGMEFKFVSPLFGEDVLEAIESLETAASASGWKTSKRAGTHIHLDVRNLDIDELHKLCVLYCFVEDIIFALGDPTRASSNFCVPWSKEQETMNNVTQVKMLKAENEQRKQMEKFQKYSALNLRALYEYGTVEFRHFPSCFNKNTLLLWVNTVMCLKRAVREVEETGQDLIVSVSSFGPKEWARRIFWPKGVISSITEMVPDYEDMLWKGMRTAQYFANMEKFYFATVPKTLIVPQEVDFQAKIAEEKRKVIPAPKPKKTTKTPPLQDYMVLPGGTMEPATIGTITTPVATRLTTAQWETAFEEMQTPRTPPLRR